MARLKRRATEFVSVRSRLTANRDCKQLDIVASEDPLSASEKPIGSFSVKFQRDLMEIVFLLIARSQIVVPIDAQPTSR